ncbi:glycosyltransferase [Schaalia sp. ZJ405]|uniref:glycosyltransferase n=1 Tax=Schaalia sp. ZJ405 TaxID=2709403 RepID=UPI0013EDEE6A|nr:glycosyltransferase [Schaalia sp. ZJ405]QPK80727.1 glycosyltransferase [Schaalia sp. ZJ405]
MKSVSVAAVVVAYNRDHMLGDTLDALGAQTRPLDDVIVVDNASTDRSLEYAHNHPVVTNTVEMKRNLGGAGGFAAGIARAISRGADLVWIMDDDTVAQPQALERLLDARERYAGSPAVLACRANWIDGREHPMNTPRERFLIDPKLRAHAQAVGAKQIRTASFVAILLDARAVREEGLPVADYFLWNDDFEYTGRLLRRRIGLYVDAARVEHRTKEFAGATDKDPGDRFFGEVRNKVWSLTRSRAFSPVDRLLYSGATLRRWAKMIAISSRPQARIADIIMGTYAGISAPRPTTEILWDTQVGREAAVLDSGTTEHPAQPYQRSDRNTRFAVLLPVWRGDNVTHFQRSLRSIGVDQIRRPSQIVVVCDGPINPGIDRILRDVAHGRRADLTADIPVKVVRLAQNSGLSHALNVGLPECECEIVARADADDISLPERFATQIPLIEAGFEMVGSAIAEFDEDESSTGLVRRMPMSAREIRQTITRRDPFNHPTIVYTKSAVAAAGGYQHVNHMEDYWLFARMIHLGIPTVNVQDPLVLYRIGAGAYQRRGGVDMFRSELRMQRLLRESRMITVPRYVTNMLVRGGYRLIPVGARKALYQTVGRLLWFR